MLTCSDGRGIKKGSEGTSSVLSGPGCWALVLAVLVVGSACSKDDQGDPASTGGSSVFGGAAGMGGTSGSSGSGGAGGSGKDSGGDARTAPKLSPRCVGIAPETDLHVDDFEDADHVAHIVPGRDGYWVVSHDDTKGTVVPDGDFFPAVGGASGTDYGGHLVASGFTEWGVSLFVRLERVVEGVRCPINATGTRGIGLWLKGTGRVRIGASTAAIVASEFGGTCDPDVERCWDNHTKLIPLPAQWTYREISWDSLQQAGWGKSAPLDVGAIIDLRFAFLPEDLPSDMWFDEVTLLSTNDGKEAGAPDFSADAASTDGAAMATLDANPLVDVSPDLGSQVDATVDAGSLVDTAIDAGSQVDASADGALSIDAGIAGD